MSNDQTYRPFNGKTDGILKAKILNARRRVKQLREEFDRIRANIPPIQREGGAHSRQEEEEMARAQYDLWRWKIYLERLERLRDKGEIVSDEAGINVYARPAMKSKVLERIPRGDYVYLMGQTHGYYKIRTKRGKIGYVRKAQLEIRAPLELSKDPGKPSGPGASDEEIEVGGARGIGVRGKFAGR